MTRRAAHAHCWLRISALLPWPPIKCISEAEEKYVYFFCKIPFLFKWFFLALEFLKIFCPYDNTYCKYNFTRQIPTQKLWVSEIMRFPVHQRFLLHFPSQGHPVLLQGNPLCLDKCILFIGSENKPVYLWVYVCTIFYPLSQTQLVSLCWKGTNTFDHEEK